MATAKKPAAKKKVARKAVPVKKVVAKAKPVKKAPIAQKVSKTKAPKSVEAKPAQALAELSELEQRFVQEYLVDLNGTQAYLRTKPGAAETTARTEASRMLAKPNIQEAVAKAKAERSQRTGISADAAVKQAWAIMTADSRELMEYRVGCCRYCWGFNFLYQRTNGQFDADKEAFENAKAMADEKGRRKMGEFKTKGGAGFDLRKPPNPDCPECGGEGKGREVFKDTRYISPEAAHLLAGVEVTKNGTKLLVHSKDSATDKVFRHLGLYNDKIQLTMPTVLIKDLTGRKD